MREPKVINVQIQAAPQVDEAELYQLTLNLRTELLELDLENVALVDGRQPPLGARAADGWADGALVMSVACSVKVLRDIIALLKSWIERNAARAVKLELDGDLIEVIGISRGSQDSLIQNWIELHSIELPEKDG